MCNCREGKVYSMSISATVRRGGLTHRTHRQCLPRTNEEMRTRTTVMGRTNKGVLVNTSCKELALFAGGAPRRSETGETPVGEQSKILQTSLIAINYSYYE